MKPISEQFEDIKQEICATRCKWLEKANKTDIKTVDDLEKLIEAMQNICEDCPLKRL